jgi:hypothetical protein
VKLTPKSLVLLAVTVLLAVLNALDLGASGPETASLPALPRLDPALVTRLTIGDQINMLVIERADPKAPWRIVAPLQYPADARMVDGYVKALSAGIPMETQVDEGNLEDYTVDDQHALRAELYTADAETPALAVIVGKTAGSESSFVRLPGSEVVYRAAVGARSRFERPAGEWRDRVVLEVPRESVVRCELVRGAETLVFRRGASPGADDNGKAIPGAWGLDGSAWGVDSDSVELIVHNLARIRAGELHNPDYDAGFDKPAVVAHLELADGTKHTVVVGSRVDDRSAWLRVDDRPEVVRVSSKVRKALEFTVAELRDRSLAGLDRHAVAEVSWREGSVTVAARWLPDTLKWSVVQPANVELEQRAVHRAVAQLAQLRAAALAPDAVFTPSGAGAALVLNDGKRWELNLGQAEEGGGRVRAKVTGRSEVFFVEARQIADIREAFGR